MQSGSKRNVDYNLLDYEEDDDDNMKRQRGEGGGVGPYGFNDEWGLGGRAPDAFGGSNGQGVGDVRAGTRECKQTPILT